MPCGFSSDFLLPTCNNVPTPSIRIVIVRVEC
jgi:hypothetical protein